jgi:RHS repeat-associated protein
VFGTRYVYLGNKQIAETSAGVTTFAHTDALGSPVARTTAAGALQSRTRFEPYGSVAAGTIPGTGNQAALGFTGHVNDADTGLVYMQQRYYDPVAGRFLSVDPVVTDEKTGSSFNRYVYGNGNPYKFKDPDGRQSYVANPVFGGDDNGGGSGTRVADILPKGGAQIDLALERVGPVAAAGGVGSAMAGGGLRGSIGTSAAAKSVPDATVVCRGGSCAAQAFANGKGVTTNPATGKLDGVSTGLGDSVASASKNIPHSKVGVTTAGEIRAAGGQVINDRGNHGTVSGLTAEKAAEVFKRTLE